jgi:hypothetical protein
VRRRRRRSTSVAAVGARRAVRRRRRHGGGGRRSTGLSIGGRSGIVPMLVQGVKDAAVITGGKAAANVVSRLIPMPVQGITGRVLSTSIAAVGVGFAANKFLGRDMARFAIAGALQAPIEGFVKSANIPYISPALGDDVLGDYYDSGVSGYPSVGAGNGGVAGYPNVEGVGDMADQEYYT